MRLQQEGAGQGWAGASTASAVLQRWLRGPEGLLLPAQQMVKEHTLCSALYLRLTHPPTLPLRQEIVKEQAPCADQAKAFADCMGWSNGDMGACQEYFDLMQSCR